MSGQSESLNPLRRYFFGLTEYTFETQLGVADPPLVDYIAELLARFIHCDTIYRVRNPAGRPLAEVAQMLVEADARLGNARREVHQHIGDFTLFWTGLYPEALRAARSGARAAPRTDMFLDYCTEGKRAYYIASTIRTSTNDEESEVLSRLSEQFELCAAGLSQIRREWERRDDEGDETPRPFLIN